MIKDIGYKVTFPFIEKYDKDLFRENLDIGDFLNSEREKSLSFFKKNNLPSPKNEEWKYFDLGKISKIKFFNPDKLGSSEKKLFTKNFPVKGPRITIANGEYCPQFSTITDYDEQIKFYSLIESDSPFYKEHNEILNKIIGSKSDVLHSLNFAFAKDLYVLVIKRGSVIKDPIELLYVSDARGDNICINSKLIVLCEEYSECSIIESCTSKSEKNLWTNYVTDINIKKNAILNHYKNQNDNLQTFHTSDCNVNIKEYGLYNHYLLNSGGFQSRNKITCLLEENLSSCNLSGSYFLSERQNTDILVDVKHLASDCYSNQKFYGIADKFSKGVFQGKIEVNQNTSNNNADQISRGIILSDNAQINAKPELSINAEDVKCSHGVSIGELDEDSIFYMRSRGISEKEAKEMLIYGFVIDTLSGINEESLYNNFDCLIKNIISNKFTFG